MMYLVLRDTYYMEFNFVEEFLFSSLLLSSFNLKLWEGPCSLTF